MHFGPVITTVVELFGTHPATGKRRREVAAHLHLVDERLLFAMTDFKVDAVVGRDRPGDHMQAFFDEYRRHFFDRRAHR